MPALLPKTFEPPAAEIKTLAPLFLPSKIKWIYRKDHDYMQVQYGEPAGSEKVACFDLDGTLFDSTIKSGSPLWDNDVPRTLRSLAEDGTAIYIVTNQGRNSNRLQEWCSSLPSYLQRLNVPCHVLIAHKYNGYRKPNYRLWDVIQETNRVSIDREQSFYVGDAAGRMGDHSDSDLKWAKNVNVKFYTPEQFFRKALQRQNLLTLGFDIKSVKKAPLHMPSNTPLLPIDQHQELIIFVGLPASGKTTFFCEHLEKAGYIHINRDILGTFDKCRRELSKALSLGQSVAMDNTSPSREDRQSYIEVARGVGVPCRCFLFTTSKQQAWHNNLYRAFGKHAPESRKDPFILPGGFSRWSRKYTEPSLDEGFKEIKHITPQLTFQTTDAHQEYQLIWEHNSSTSRYLENPPAHALRATH